MGLIFEILTNKYQIIKMDRKRRANDTLRSQVRKHRLIQKFKENSIQNHCDSSDRGKVHKFLLYLLQNIILRDKLLFISESVEHNVEEQNIKVYPEKSFI